jgi:hypothetical protein
VLVRPGVAFTWCAFFLLTGGLELSYLDSLYLEFECGIFIDDQHGIAVQLEARESPHMVETAFDAFLQSQGFVGAGDDNYHLTGLGGSTRQLLPCPLSIYPQDRTVSVPP